MSFARPMLLWLAAVLPLALLAGVLIYARRRRRVARALGGVPMAQRLGAGELGRFPSLRLALLLLAGGALGLAAAGPQWGFAAAEGRTRALDLVLALDVSNSMLASDLQPSRLERERLLASQLLRELAGDRIGLVAFAGQGYVLAPLTIDHGALQLYIDALDPEILSSGGTALSSAIRQATDVVRAEDTGGDRAVVIVSDGEALEDEQAILESAERAKTAGVIVHTVGVGTPEGARVPDVDPETGQVVGWIHDLDGSIVVSRLNEPLLQRIARITGGTYVHLGEAGSSQRLVSVLQGMRRGVTDSRGRRLELQDRTGWFVAFALLLLAIDALIARREITSGPMLRRPRLWRPKLMSRLGGVKSE